MGRYIDADKVVDVMKVAYWDENMHSAKDDPCVIDAMIDWSIRQIKDAPTEAVAPVVHAHWIRNVFGVPICSACHKGWDDQPEKDGSPLFEYCPCCGAIMDEEVGK